ncbi:MAG TPA: hypothetical protein VMR43_10330 [Variovorax sp.]|nr:hypothetical protein [Variovorax sp.]
MINGLEKLRAIAACTATAGMLALAGCGGGGGGDGGPTNIGGNGGSTSGGTVPISALQNSDSFVAYLKQVVANKLDTSEPIDLGSIVAPTSNTTEAVGI